MKMIKTVLYILVFSAFYSPLYSQNIQKIAAVVNHEIISEYDIHQRAKLTAATRGINFSDNFYNKIRSRTLENLITEKIQIQKSIELQIIVTDNEVQNGIDFLEKQNNMSKGKLIQVLKSRDIDIYTLRDQIKSNLAWSNLVGSRLRTKVIVTDDEINAKLEMQNNLNQQFDAIVDLKQILLPLKLKDKKNSTKEQLMQAEAIIKKIKDCSDFIEIARKFGNKDSWNLGKVKIADTPPKFKKVLQQLEIGKVSKPIKTNQGIHIFIICDKTIGNLVKKKLKIRNEIGQEKLNALATKYLSDIRREAIIDIR
tara:strand:- start:376 stop:1308 length:933 start_codon:yes stop_codon:yes gene_type:complete